MIIIACRGFALGLAFFLTERHDGDPSFTIPDAARARCLNPPKLRDPRSD